jgi:PIN domain nuclease of toxin-antitoxin system
LPSLDAGLSAFAEKLVVIPLDARIAPDAVSLDLPHRDPFDRVVAATARVRGLTLITKDSEIVDAGVVATRW